MLKSFKDLLRIHKFVKSIEDSIWALMFFPAMK